MQRLAQAQSGRECTEEALLPWALVIHIEDHCYSYVKNFEKVKVTARKKVSAKVEFREDVYAKYENFDSLIRRFVGQSGDRAKPLNFFSIKGMEIGAR